MRRFRIGAVSFLNSKPLIRGLADRPDCVLEFAVPSRLADGLALDQYDAALVPVASLFDHPQWSVVSDACIACHGPVWSVKLCSRVPMEQVRSIALDESSRTSVLLVKILLTRYRERGGAPPDWDIDYRPLPVSSDWTSTSADAALIIGDRAMATPPAEFVEVWDLGQRWWEETGYPFVFAVWATAGSMHLDELGGILNAAHDRGLNELRQIAHEQAPVYNLTTDRCCAYFSKNLHFELGVKELEGLLHFYATARQLNYANNGWELNRHHDWQPIG